MLKSMSLLKQSRKLLTLTICAVLLAGCGVASPTPTATAITMPTSTSVIPTSTEPLPTFTPTLVYLPTLTPLPNSTPAAIGAYFDVPSDVLGPQYEIENAYYFDKPETGERYEFYAGALAGSGDEETAQGVMVLRVLRFSAQVGNAEVIATQEYLTPIQVGPLRIRVDFTGSILLFTPLHFEWTFFVRNREMINLGNPPLARLEIGEESQLAGRGSFCWKGSCLDGPVIYTSSEPLVVKSNPKLNFFYGLIEEEMSKQVGDNQLKVQYANCIFLNLASQFTSKISEKPLITSQDWAYRIKQYGWRVMYVPSVVVHHHKRASSSQRPFGSIRNFYHAMRIFYRKYYAATTPAPIGWLIEVGITIKEFMGLGRNLLRPPAARRVE